MNIGENATSLGNTYAKALLDLALDSSVAEAVRDDLIALRQFMAENPDMVTMMGSPWFSQKQKMEILERLFSGRVNQLTLDFIMVAASHGRLMFLPQMISGYTETHDVLQGLQTVRVTVSEEASVQKVNELVPRMSAILKSKVRLDVSVDPSIIGGLVLRYGEKVIDNSTRTRLSRAIATIIKRQDSQG
jgi:F-type H+-transporting ATPase subunit delta